MTKWSFDAESNSGTLLVEGDVTINYINELKKSLLEAFEGAQRVTVDVSSATAVDVAGVQLLCASHRFSIGRGKKMCLQIGGNEQFSRFIDDVGIPQDFICNHDNANACF